MTSGASAANSAACLRISAALMVAQRVSIRTLWPMVQPDCCSPCRNAPKRVCHTGSSAAAGSSTPMRRTLVAACCARAAKRANPSNYGAGLLTEGAEWEGYQAAHRRADDDVRPHLRSALGRPGLRRQAGGPDVRQHGLRCHAGGQDRRHVLVPIPDPKLGPRKLDVTTMSIPSHVRQ